MTESKFHLDTPVLFIIFNRPDTTARVFEAIRAAKPRMLFIAADGPRPNIPGDVERCAATRAVVERIDWPCDVRRDYSEKNMNCRYRPQSAIRWAFSQAERVIILEDDCLPDPSFFHFCQDILLRFANDERVMCIGGTNLLGTWKADIQSYHFSFMSSSSGWASWRRAWDLYDPDMEAWGNPEASATLDRDLFSLAPSKKRRKYYELTYQGEMDAWDYQWEMCRILQSGLTVTPSVNLVQNIGYHAEAMHTFDVNHPHAKLTARNLEWPLRPPFGIVRDIEFERKFLSVIEIRFNWRSLIPEPIRIFLRPLADKLGMRGKKSLQKPPIQM
jgi:hypothetical protein